LADLLSRFGVESQLRAATGSTDKGGWQKEAPKPGISLGVKTVAEGGQVKLSHVFNNGPAQQAGLSAHDVLVAIDGLRVTPTNLETLLASRPAGNKREFWLFRRDELMRFQVLPEETPADTWGLRLQDAKGEQLLARNAWLHGRVDSVLP
jgi:predicted metalloprotease with PDZ domain